MTELRLLVLNEEDTKQIIAGHFNVPENDVEIALSTGDPQYPELSMHAKVRLNNQKGKVDCKKCARTHCKNYGCDFGISSCLSYIPKPE